MDREEAKERCKELVGKEFALIDQIAALQEQIVKIKEERWRLEEIWFGGNPYHSV